MNLVANLKERVKLNSILRIKKILDGVGSFNAIVKQEVEPQDILGEFQLSAGYTNINVAKNLNLSPEQAKRCLQKRIGERIYKGELLASKTGILGNKIITSPTDGILENYNLDSGELRMKYLPKKVQLTAGVYGIVEEVDKTNSYVMIKTMAHEVFGLFGSGKERSGILNVINNRSNLMSQDQVRKGNFKGHIIALGALIYREAIQEAVTAGVVGIISGGLNAKDFSAMTGSIYSSNKHFPNEKLVSDIGISVLATEGFGPIPLGDDIFSKLKEYDGKYVFINGNLARVILPVLVPDIIMKLRNVVLPPNAKFFNQQAQEVGEISAGCKVRLIWPPFVGAQGSVVSVDKSATILPSGISTYMITVKTPLRKIKVPYPNVELIS